MQGRKEPSREGSQTPPPAPFFFFFARFVCGLGSLGMKTEPHGCRQKSVLSRAEQRSKADLKCKQNSTYSTSVAPCGPSLEVHLAHLSHGSGQRIRQRRVYVLLALHGREHDLLASCSKIRCVSSALL